MNIENSDYAYQDEQEQYGEQKYLLTFLGSLKQLAEETRSNIKEYPLQLMYISKGVVDPGDHVLLHGLMLLGKQHELAFKA